MKRARPPFLPTAKTKLHFMGLPKLFKTISPWPRSCRIRDTEDVTDGQRSRGIAGAGRTRRSQTEARKYSDLGLSPPLPPISLKSLDTANTTCRSWAFSPLPPSGLRPTRLYSTGTQPFRQTRRLQAHVGPFTLKPNPGHGHGRADAHGLMAEPSLRRAVGAGAPGWLRPAGAPPFVDAGGSP